MSRVDTTVQRVCTPTAGPTPQSEAGLLTPCWPLLPLLLLLCWLLGTWAHRTPRGIYTLTIHDSPHSSPSVMFLQLTLCDLHISVPTFRQAHKDELCSAQAIPWATRGPLRARRPPSRPCRSPRCWTNTGAYVPPRRLRHAIRKPTRPCSLAVTAKSNS